MTHLGPAQPWTPVRPPRPRWWTPAILAQLAVVVATLAGGIVGASVLDGRDKGTDVLSVVQAASTSTAAQPTLHATMTMRVTGSGIEITTKADTLIDQVRKVSTGSVTVPTLGALQIVSANGVVYFQLPGARTDASGHHWLSFRGPQGAAALGEQDPLSLLKAFGDPKDVSRIGTDSIHGVQTTHYRITLDPSRLQALVAKSGTGFNVPPGVLDQLKNADLQLWIDGKHLVRRMDMALDIKQISMRMRMELSDYGQPVEVHRPADSDVSQLASPMQLGQVLGGIATGVHSG